SVPAAWTGKSPLRFPEIPFLQQAKQAVESRGYGAENYDGEDYHVEFKDLGAVNNQVAQAFSRPDKFSDDYAHQAQADIDLEGAEQIGNRRGKHHFQEAGALASAQGLNQLHHVGVGFPEAGIEAHNGAEKGYRHAGHDDGP